MRLWPGRISIPRINCEITCLRTHARSSRNRWLGPVSCAILLPREEEWRDKDEGRGRKGDDEEKEKRKGWSMEGETKRKRREKKNSQGGKGRRNGETMQFLLLSRGINIVLYRSRSSWHIRIQITPGLRLCLFNQLLKLH